MIKNQLVKSSRQIGRLQGYFPEKTDSIPNILLHMDRLRRKIEQEFPDARKFKRPGFDDIT